MSGETLETDLDLFRDYVIGGIPIKLSQSQQLFDTSIVNVLADWFGYTSNLVSRSYGADEEVRQAIFDSLSSFQIVSKLWAVSALSRYGIGIEEQTIVHVGSWFGSLTAICSSLPGLHCRYRLNNIVMVDKDAGAMEIAKHSLTGPLEADQYLVEDIFNCSFLQIPNVTFVWPGVEHFVKEDIVEFILGCPSSTTFILLGTNLEDTDHINPVNSVDDLKQYFHDDQIKYHGELRHVDGTRFMVVASL